MIFEALLLLPRADNRPGNRYLLWRKLHACAIFHFGVVVCDYKKSVSFRSMQGCIDPILESKIYNCPGWHEDSAPGRI